MTVLLIILLLLSLLIPVFVTLKRNARTVLCKSQMRQIGVLMNSYAANYNGYLPNFSVKDIPSAGLSGMQYNNNLYENWNGHLIPFLDTSIKSFDRFVKVFKDGQVHNTNAITLPNAPQPDPANPMAFGWAVIRDAFTKGGHGDLKVFICPEIYGNTYDVKASINFLGLQIPRIRFSHPIGFVGPNYFEAGGTPTTYAANSHFFKRRSNTDLNSLRMDAISEVSKKVFLIEAGFQAGTAYRGGSATECYYGGGAGTETESLSLSAYGNSFGKENAVYTGIGLHFLNFVHDDQGPFWTSYGVNLKVISWSADVIKRFNEQFKNKAIIVPSGIGHHIISFVDPQGGVLFASFFADPINKGYILWTTFAPYLNFKLYDEPEFHYMVGNMDVLFGDGHVESVGMDWLLNNRESIAKETKE